MSDAVVSRRVLWHRAVHEKSVTRVFAERSPSRSGHGGNLGHELLREFRRRGGRTGSDQFISQHDRPDRYLAHLDRSAGLLVRARVFRDLLELQ